MIILRENKNKASRRGEERPFPASIQLAQGGEEQEEDGHIEMARRSAHFAWHEVKPSICTEARQGKRVAVPKILLYSTRVCSRNGRGRLEGWIWEICKEYLELVINKNKSIKINKQTVLNN